MSRWGADMDAPRQGILEIEQPFHPIGQPDSGAEDGGLDMSVFTTVTPSYPPAVLRWAILGSKENRDSALTCGNRL